MTHRQGLNCIFLTGAPLVDELSWHEADLTIVGAIIPRKATTQCSSSASSVTPSPKWRVVGSDHQSNDRTEHFETRFWSTADLQHDLGVDDFIEHSVLQLDALDGIEVSDLTTSSQDEIDGPTLDSFHSATSGTEHYNEAGRLPTTSPPRQLLITDLREIPNASLIERIAPQTMTVHILVGIVVIQPARTVMLRRSNAQIDLVEVIVGDDTRSGFAITFWLPPGDKAVATGDDLRTQLTVLRSGDLAVVSNIALTTYKGCVYGQSLSRRALHAKTKIWSLRTEQHASSPLAGKISRVAEWRNHFIGRDSCVGQVSRNSDEDRLPPDTP